MPKNIYEPAFVADLFDRCSGPYRRWSMIASFGMIRRWRKLCVRLVPDVPKSPVVFDLMAGTGEVWPHWLRAHPNTAEIVAMDISKGMHREAVQRLHSNRQDKIRHICADVLEADFVENEADVVLSTFGLKTFNAEQQTKLAHQVARVLKPGGSFALIEAADPVAWKFRPLYRLYMDGVLPLIEKLVLKGAQDFSMIGTYTKNFQDCSHFEMALRDAGLEVSRTSDMFGCASAVYGRKPSLI